MKHKRHQNNRTYGKARGLTQEQPLEARGQYKDDAFEKLTRKSIASFRDGATAALNKEATNSLRRVILKR
ncbi:MAG: hypothetical protein ACOX6Y_03010 [Christensenellales bacterium]|jgi:hypothetical protein